MADNQGLFLLTAEQREELQSWAQSRSLPAGYVFRARLILAIGEGETYREIEDSLGADAPTASNWKGRFEQLVMEGLQGQHKGSTPRSATPALQGRVIRRAQQTPSDGSTHWSVRNWRRRWASASRRCTASWRKPNCSRIDWNALWLPTIRRSSKSR